MKSSERPLYDLTQHQIGTLEKLYSQNGGMGGMRGLGNTVGWNSTYASTVWSLRSEAAFFNAGCVNKDNYDEARAWWFDENNGAPAGSVAKMAKYLKAL